MRDQMEQALAIQNLMGNEAINVLWEILDELTKESADKLVNIIETRPDTLTGKTAVRLAARARALRDFKEAVLETQSILKQPSTSLGRE